MKAKRAHKTKVLPTKTNTKLVKVIKSQPLQILKLPTPAATSQHKKISVLTWKEFKALGEQLGLVDDDIVELIDLYNPTADNVEIAKNQTGVCIWHKGEVL